MSGQETDAKPAGAPTTVIVNINAVDTLTAILAAVQALSAKVDVLVTLPDRIAAVTQELNTHVASLKAAVDAQKPSAA